MRSTMDQLDFARDLKRGGSQPTIRIGRASSVDEVALAVAPDDDRSAAHELEVDAQRLAEAFHQRQRGVCPTAFDDRDIPAADAGCVGKFLLADVERDAGVATERREGSPKDAVHDPIQLIRPSRPLNPRSAARKCKPQMHIGNMRAWGGAQGAIHATLDQ